MTISVRAGPYQLRGVSIGGIFTSIAVPELGVLLDCGRPERKSAAIDHVFLSHGHGDHASGLASLVGIRELLHQKPPPRVYVPAEIADDVEGVMRAMRAVQRHELYADIVPMLPGDTHELRRGLSVRAFRTDHTVPSLGYVFFDRVQKLRPEHLGLAGAEIARRKAAGEELFTAHDRLLLAYATDTRIEVLDAPSEILRAQVLVLECSFLDERKRMVDSRAGGHIHLDELVAVAERFENEHLVLMHFSLIYQPREVREILARRLPKHLMDRVVVFAPQHGGWPR